MECLHHHPKFIVDQFVVYVYMSSIEHKHGMELQIEPTVQNYIAWDPVPSQDYFEFAKCLLCEMVRIVSGLHQTLMRSIKFFLYMPNANVAVLCKVFVVSVGNADCLVGQ